MEELLSWLTTNKIQHKQIDNEVVEIIGFGKMFLVDTEDDRVKSIFKKASKDEEVTFNLLTDKEALLEESIFYIAFKFGNNWYYYDLREKFAFNVIKYIGEHIPRQIDLDFVNLGVHTPFDLLNGSGAIAAWIKKAKHLGHLGLGICDQNTMAGTIHLQTECAKSGLKYVFGYSLNIQPSEDDDFTVPAKVYSISNTGLQNMLRIQKTIMVDSVSKTISIEDLAKYGEGNLLVFGTLSASWLFDSLGFDNRIILRKPVVHLQKYFDDIFYQVDLSEYKAERFDVEVLESVKEFFSKSFLSPERWFVKPILICDNYYLDKDEAVNKINLNKIASGAAHNQSEDQYFKDIDEYWATFSGIMDPEKWNVKNIFSEMCGYTVAITQKATASFETTRNFMPEYSMPEQEKAKYGDRHTMFIQLLEEGFNQLVPYGQEKKYRDRLDYEIYVLESTNNVDYMLVQYDTVNWARANGILVGAGRGSAGGSLILYLLGITLVDPLKYDLLFERFLLPERAGLYPSDVTKIVEPINDSEYVEIEFDNAKKYKFACDALLLVKDGDETIEVYADELREDDEIIFDNKDLLWSFI